MQITCYRGRLSAYLSALRSHVLRLTSYLEPRTSNLEPRTSNLEPRTSNLEPRTSNLERQNCVRRHQFNHAGRAGRATLADPVRSLWAGDRVRASHLRLGIGRAWQGARPCRSEEHTSELQSLMRISYAVFCL